MKPRAGVITTAAVALALVATATAAAAALAGCRRSAADLVRAEETITQSVDIAIWSMSPQVEVETLNGNVSVVAGTSATVDVTVVKRAAAADKAAAEALLDEISVSIEDLGSARVRVRVTGKSDPTGGSTIGADVQLTLPGHSAASVRTSNGTVKVEGIVGPVVARSSNGGVTVAAGGSDTEVSGTDVETSNGSVTVTGPARDVRVVTSNASVKLEGARGTLDVRTSNGAVTLEATEALVSAHTSNAFVTFGGSLAPGDHRFETSNGTVTVELPVDASFRLSARTSGGGILSDFPLTPAPPANATRVEATAGTDPQASISVDTSNGDIKLRAGR